MMEIDQIKEYEILKHKGSYKAKLILVDINKNENVSKNNLTVFQYFHGKNILLKEQQKEFYKQMLVNADPTKEREIKKKNHTKNNHIIPRDYFSRWAKSEKEQRIKTNNGEYSLEKYMSMDYAFIQALENNFTGKDKNGKVNKDRLNVEKINLIENLNKLNDLAIKYDLDFFYKMKNNDHMFDFTFNTMVEKSEKNNRYLMSKIEYITKNLNSKEHELMHYLNSMETRQNLLNYIKKDKKQNMINILQKILSDFKINKNFYKYHHTIYVFGMIMKLNDAAVKKETLEQISKIIIQGQKIINDNISLFYNEQGLKFIEEFQEDCERKVKEFTQLSEILFKELEIVNNLGYSIHDTEEIQAFLESLLLFVENFDGEVSYFITAQLNSALYLDLVEEKNREDKNVFIIYCPQKLKTTNKLFFTSKFRKLKMFAISPHLLMMSGKEEDILFMKKLKKLGLNQLIYEIYTNEIHKLKDCDIVE